MIIKEIIDMMGGGGDVSFKHQSRESNRDAHNIARNSLELEVGRHVWLLERPGYAETLINDK